MFCRSARVVSVPFAGDAGSPCSSVGAFPRESVGGSYPSGNPHCSNAVAAADALRSHPGVVLVLVWAICSPSRPAPGG